MVWWGYPKILPSAKTITPPSPLLPPRVLGLHTVKVVAVAEIQFRVVQNVRDVGGERGALVIAQPHFATIRLQAAD